VGWTAAVGAGLRTLLSRRIASLSDERSWSRRAGDKQRRQLDWLLRRAAATEVGREHGFDEVLRAPAGERRQAFRAAVPVQDYEDHRPLLERMRQGGEANVTWPGVVRDWAQTSGTTSGDKYVPVSRELLAHNRRAALDVYAHAVRFGVSLSRVFAGRSLFLGGSTSLSENEHGIRTGDLSGVVTRLIRWPLTSVVLPTRDVALMDHWPSKIDAMARQCLNADIRWLSGMPSWALVLFERMVEVARERGREVARLEDLWPNLEVFVHGGVKYDPFEARMRRMWSGDASGQDIPVRLEVYPASEGFIAIQDRRGEPGLRLNVDHRVFYEFIPLEEAGADDPSAFMCDEVEPGQRYVVVMSTCGGLWRYLIGDVVEFDTIPPDGPPRLRIVGRHKHFINAFGENIIVEQIEGAVAEAARSAGVVVGEFTAAPVYPDERRGAGLELLVEWVSPAPAPEEVVAAFGRTFDEALKARNNDYTTKRTSDLGMEPPAVTPVAPGAFHRWLESRGKLGGQHKCPRCANDRGVLEAVLESAGGAERPAPAGAGL